MAAEALMRRHLPPRRFPAPAALGVDGEGPWEDRSDVVAIQHPNPAAAGGYLNAHYSVQLFQYLDHPGVDHLIVRRHDGAHVHPGWAVLQRIKDQLAPKGESRFAFEVYPPAALVVDNELLYHLWVMPLGWQPGIGLHSGQEGSVRV